MQRGPNDKKTKKAKIMREGRLAALPEHKPTALEAFMSNIYIERHEQKQEIADAIKRQHNQDESGILKQLIQVLGLCTQQETNLSRHLRESNIQIIQLQLKMIERFMTIQASLPTPTATTLALIEHRIANMQKNIEELKAEISNKLKTADKLPHKRFKAIGIGDTHIDQIAPNQTGAKGIYTGKHSVFFGSKDSKGNVNKIIGTLIHEGTHFAMNELFHNQHNPYPASQGQASDLEQHFALVIRLTKLQILEMSKTASDQEYGPSHIIGVSFTGYNEDEHAKELIVRVPEIIATFGNEGHQWLQQHTPQLLNFYEKKIMPKIAEYLQAKEFNTVLRDESEAKASPKPGQ